MAKTSAIQRNLKRIRLAKKFLRKREGLKKIIKDKKLPLAERFAAQLKLAKIPRNSARIRIRNRCEITGRPHGVYRKLRISRILKRDFHRTKDQIEHIIKSQLTDKESFEKADYILENNEKSLLLPEVIDLYEKIRKKAC